MRYLALRKRANPSPAGPHSHTPLHSDGWCDLLRRRNFLLPKSVVNCCSVGCQSLLIAIRPHKPRHFDHRYWVWIRKKQSSILEQF